MVKRSARRTRPRLTGKKVAGRTVRQYARLVASLYLEVDDLYRALDAQLTRMAEIQLEFDGLRSKLRHL